MKTIIRFALDLIWVLIFMGIGFTLYNWLFSSMNPVIFTLMLAAPFAACITINTLIFNDFDKE